ncbi:PSD1 and planctomycete cytochrome C domain-containing protein [Anatilimnocola floriformis]|uniref:PSD1 and planctomycete cytochrome C domain-containing protein n=1 Tax=Anatilimnocola floriformis TaxID=2948575 RepID=UPI0020C21E39|nr:PSD1 and planctomycete cytochrome C domain-containing protein [Anatilimnocola floriformis]
MRNVERRMQNVACVSRFCATVALCLYFVNSLRADDQEGNRFFESKIRPILVKHCYECHGPDLQENKLRVDSLEGINRGGKAGALIIAGKPEKSLLIAAVGYQVPDLQMPPDKKLGEREIADLTAWVKMGAPHPDRQAGGPAVVEKFDLAEGKKFWSFQPIVDHPTPAVKDVAWAKNGVDSFVLAQLEAKDIRPAAAVDKLTLLRRATFDLTGLPPTPAEIATFLQDESPTAFAAVVDRLLDSPHYGERWGRHWLDVARYADSNGVDENVAHGNAWRYRDYVVRSLNADKPYDQFLVEQLAGDLLPPTDDTAMRNDRLIATGFLSLGPKVLAEVDKTKMEMDILDEQLDTVGRSILGLTFGCARCHDHKFDPIRAEDYYAMVGIFKSTRTMETFTTIAKWWENPLAPAAEVQRKVALDKLVAEQKAALDALLKKSKDELAAKLKPAELPKDFETQLSPEVQTELKVRREELARLTASVPVIPTAMGVSDGKVTDVPVHIRGSHLALGEVAQRGFPVVLVSTEQPKLPADRSGRLELANWLVRRDHPLTARVMVNRIWRWHFGQGLVSTTDNFGKLGERPSHPELLDWLAARFMDSGWSLKKMHRLIMLSQTYQQSSAFDAKGFAADPENRLYWRMPLRRLEAEEIRDALLTSSGLLDRTPGTSLLHVGNREFLFDHTSKDGTKYDSKKRSLYLPVIRNNLYDVFQLFDATDATVLDGNRATTVVAPQALFMLNSDLVLAASKGLAESVIAETASPSTRVEQLYLRTFGRSPNATEVERAMAYVEKQRTAGKSEAEAWSSFGHVLFSANEFIYLK